MKLDELYALLRRRGILWPTAEIYGGAQGLYDYGPLGTALKRRLERAWAAWFVGRSPDYYQIEPAEIVPEAVVRASGHLENFTDPEITCDACHAVFRAETVLEKVRPAGVDGLSPAQIEEVVRTHQVRCPSCGSTELSVPQAFNLMFDVPFGVARTDRAYLLPETAQASYLAFARMWEVGRKALPLGIAVVGRVYRNEIAPRQVLFRMRSFTQAELQIFFDPAEPPGRLGSLASEKVPVLRVDRRERGEGSPELLAASELVASGLPEFYVDHLVHMLRFLRDVLGYPGERIRFLEKSEKERAFYNRLQFDAEVHLESLGGYKEVGAVHYRGDYDLRRHGEGSGKDLSVSRAAGERVVPHVLELTFGVDRNVWALADVHLGRDGERTVWRLPPYLAPVSVGVFPLIAKEHRPFAERLTEELLAAGVDAEYDEASSIGKRYARMDEAGTPFCVTVDGLTVGDGAERGTVTLRARDSKAQERVPAAGLAERIGPSLRPPRPPSV
jgi:glycyl-tRNA synthetase